MGQITPIVRSITAWSRIHSVASLHQVLAEDRHAGDHVGQGRPASVATIGETSAHGPLRTGELDWLWRSGRSGRDFVDYLERLRFIGDVHAMAEGTVVFLTEPILRITAPMPQAQLVESRLINLLHFQTVIASKARTVLVAPGKGLIDFGLRRAHGARLGSWLQTDISQGRPRRPQGGRYPDPCG